jgi:hypothetical protein
MHTLDVLFEDVPRAAARLSRAGPGRPVPALRASILDARTMGQQPGGPLHLFKGPTPEGRVAGVPA